MELTSVLDKFFCIDKLGKVYYIIGVDLNNDSPYPNYITATGKLVPMDIINLYFDKFNGKIICKLKRK